jgi:hypothetical protein
MFNISIKLLNIVYHEDKYLLVFLHKHFLITVFSCTVFGREN